MQDDALATVSWRAPPRSFVALMALYESNYIRLGWLAGDLARLAGHHCSKLPADCELRLTVLERARYTSCVELTYALPDPPAAIETMPDLYLRIYHDARLVEAQGCGRQRPLQSLTDRELGHRWQRNIMLNKWLEYCAERGHRFSTATRHDSGA